MVRSDDVYAWFRQGLWFQVWVRIKVVRRKWRWITFQFRLVPQALEGNKVNRHKGLWQVRKVLEVCLGLVLEMVSIDIYGTLCKEVADQRGHLPAQATSTLAGCERPA